MQRGGLRRLNGDFQQGAERLALFLLAESLDWPEWQTAIVAGLIAAVYIAVIVRSVQKSGRGPALLNRNIWLVYLAYIAILWNLWFFSFWSVQIVKEAAQSSLLAAALTAAFNAGAGILGFPAGGWLADRWGRVPAIRLGYALAVPGLVLLVAAPSWPAALAAAVLLGVAGYPAAD